MALWFAARAFGLVSLTLLTAVMVLGLLVAGRPRRSYVVTALHRSLALMSVALIALHVATVVLDGYVPVGWIDAVVPFMSSYERFWQGLGTVAIDVLLALVVTSLLRGRLGPRAWRAVHWLAYLCWPVALVHALGIGTDSVIVMGVAAASVVAVGVAAVVRLSRGRRTAARRRPAGSGRGQEHGRAMVAGGAR
ncbi:ferric reductase-like transmembrane domain-containing protein [Actinomadura barringtoniae]|uniref:Ferric reductase-like transmembrane domain-containing protein n=1 Tax=Actinomadura barringtoniae TaxID=1427535 RepID=A0A939PL78_9ACTN|nr:ferric reductase-like transmembrane domain-containing protein [Actinomadura barringtoniae]MBO2454665.1 ferric reductase-like transmembrane domain-containing protein [Actinomadura barringtoniae]